MKEGTILHPARCCLCWHAVCTLRQSTFDGNLELLCFVLFLRLLLFDHGYGGIMLAILLSIPKILVLVILVNRENKCSILKEPNVPSMHSGSTQRYPVGVECQRHAWSGCINQLWKRYFHTSMNLTYVVWDLTSRYEERFDDLNKCPSYSWILYGLGVVVRPWFLKATHHLQKQNFEAKCHPSKWNPWLFFSNYYIESRNNHANLGHYFQQLKMSSGDFVVFSLL